MATAVSLSTTLFSNIFQPNPLQKDRASVNAFPPRNLTFSLHHEHGHETINSSPRKNRVTVSAISGSPGTDTSSVSEDTANLLDRVQVFNLNGNGIPISDLWKDRKAVVAFARHFGCVLCRKRADYLASKKDRMDASGVALVLIGPGSIDQARAFTEQTKFKGEVYADPGHSSYETLKFVSGVSTTFTPRVRKKHLFAGLKIIQAYMEGYRQDWGLSFESDTMTTGGWQQGGIIVAGPGKSNISYIHKGQQRNWICGFVGKLGNCTSLEAELWVIQIGLKLAMEKCYTRLEVKSDSLVAVNLIQDIFLCLLRIASIYWLAFGNLPSTIPLEKVIAVLTFWLGNEKLRGKDLSLWTTHPWGSATF